ncbi:hypothetical protein [Nocardiopsis oceani]
MRALGGDGRADGLNHDVPDSLVGAIDADAEKQRHPRSAYLNANARFEDPDVMERARE